MEAQNKKLQLELEHLRLVFTGSFGTLTIDEFVFLFSSRGKWGSQTEKVKEMYEVEIREARKIIDDTAKDRAAAELRAKRAEEETLKFKDKYVKIIALFSVLKNVFSWSDMKPY